jgi:succinylarginine dihydrolase
LAAAVVQTIVTPPVRQMPAASASVSSTSDRWTAGGATMKMRSGGTDGTSVAPLTAMTPAARLATIGTMPI